MSFAAASRPLRYLSAAAALALLLFAAAPAPAQKNAAPPQPKYDSQSEMKFKGSVAEIKVPPKESPREVVHMLLKNGNDLMDVYLCPSAYLDDMGVTFHPGDEVSLTGSKIKQDASDLILAREVVKSTDTLVLRDDKGNPVWSWRR